MTRAFHGQLLAVVAVVAATVAACGGGPDQPSPSPATTPAPPATSTATATATATASPPPTATPATATATATATASPSPTPAPATATATASPTPVAPEATTFRYNAYDTTGAVATPGSYAFLSDPDDTSTVVTTYEALRDGTTTALLIHTSDTDGASRAALYDTVEAGDLFEWHQADDCFVRYRVTDVPEAEATATHREFGVRWETYVFQGCQTGSLSMSATVTFTAAPELPLDHLGGTRLTDFAVVHGPWQLAPHTQSAPGVPGIARASVAIKPPDYRDPGRQPDFGSPAYPANLTEARQLRYWREPTLPEGWTFWRAVSGDIAGPVWGYCATWKTADGYIAVDICGSYTDVRQSRFEASWLTNHNPPRLIVREPLVIAGRPAWVEYSPLGEQHHPSGSVVVVVYDPATETIYEVQSSDADMLGANSTPVIAIARSLFEGPTGRALYDTYDTTGAVSTPGSYAFLSDPDDTSTAVTTYEALRDGTATALLIHTSDAGGASRAVVYDAVEAGDTFEWRHVDDCWVRYIVEDVKPDPTGTAPRKLLALRWVTYTYSGCTGAIPSAGDRFMSWTPPAVQRPESGRMPAPVRHGPWLVMPLGWTGELQEVRYLGQRDPVEPSQVLHTTDIDEARREIPLWREPSGIPGTWTLGEVLVGGEVGPWSGFEASWESPKGRVIIIVVHSRWRKDHLRGVGTGAVMEMRRIGGHPAIVQYWPPEDKDSGTRVFLYDESTGIEVFVAAYSLELGETVAVALSLVDAHDPPTTSQPPVPATATPSPTPVAPGATTFRYDTYDTTGAVSTPGSYAFLADPDDTTTVVTTYEGLRDGTTTALLIHTSDAGGASRADAYDAVEVGDLFEWRQADDCFIRYQITEVKADPAGDVPRKLLGVEWLTYAFAGCSGAIETGGEHRIGWSPANITSPDVTSPIRHGNWLIVPQNWTGAMEEYVLVPYRENPECEGDEPTTLEEHAFGRRPALPDDWVVENIREMMCDLLHVTYRSADWTADIDVYISRQWAVPFHIPWVDPSNTHEVVEATMIDGHPAVLRYDSRGFFNLNVKIYHSSGIKYEVWTSSQSLVSNRQAVIDIARSLYDTPSPTPVAPGATTFRYDTYDTTGAVSTPGSYAFLADPADPSTVVTTYEALRDGTTTALLVHTSDADGVSRADVYDAVEAGDLFEWHQADDCFVRYTVTEVKPDPAGTVPRKLLGVAWLTYAFAGCSGTIETGGEHSIGWSPANITSPDVTSPIRHGNWLVVPDGWTGVTEDEVLIPNRQSPECEGDPPTTLEEHAFWRRPALPDDWVVDQIHYMGCDFFGVTYRSPEWTSVDVFVGRGWAVPFHLPWADPQNDNAVVEATMIDGHPAVLLYDRHSFFGLDVVIYHSSGIVYQVQTSSQSLVSNRQAVIDIARSLYD